jgi:hypothetical protein
MMLATTAAARLADRVIPRFPGREWALTVPKAALLSALLSIRPDLGPAHILH